MILNYVYLTACVLFLYLQSGNARVMAHDPLQSMIVVSKPSTSSLVSAYGLTKVRKLKRYNIYHFLA